MRPSRWTWLIALAVLVGACNNDDSPISPDPPEPPPVEAPVITSVAASVSRAEVGDEVAISAQVNPGDGAGTLTYQWSASTGTVTGTGATATWRSGQQPVETPADVVVTLTVVKPYQALVNGQIVSREHRVTAEAESFRLHDSEAEVSAMALHFLIDLFGDSRLSADQCLVDFWPGCPGRDREYDDIVANRATRRITSVEADVERVTLNSDLTSGHVDVSCTFHDINLAEDRPETWTGDCGFDVVYRDDRWWLCTSTIDNEVRVRGVDGTLPHRPVSGYASYLDQQD